VFKHPNSFKTNPPIISVPIISGDPGVEMQARTELVENLEQKICGRFELQKNGSKTGMLEARYPSASKVYELFDTSPPSLYGA